MARLRKKIKAEKGSGLPVHEGRLNEALAGAHEWFRNTKYKGSAKLIGRVRLMVMMVTDYRDGTYTKIPAFSIWMMVFSLLYVAGPFDLLPEFIPGMGWLDDAFVVGLVFGAASHDLKKYCKATDLDPKLFGL